MVEETRVQLCGRLAVTWRGERVESQLPARQGRLLFGYLVVHRARPMRRDDLIRALWDDAPAAAEGTLRALLSRLRRVLGRDALPRSDQPALVLPDDAFVDLEAALEALHRAEAAIAAGDPTRAWAPARVALHTTDRGFLPECDRPWVLEVRAGLDDVRLRALECVGQAGIMLGGVEVAAAERAGRRLIQLAPFRETGHRLLMEALAARGNTAEALLAYERLRVLLREELGIPPGRDVQSLHGSLIARH